MKETIYILCGDYDVNSGHADGSVMTRCHKCDCPLWIAPSGLQIVSEQSAEPICTRCIKTQMEADRKEGSSVDLMPINQEQEKEILKYMTKEDLLEAHKQLIERLGIEK